MSDPDSILSVESVVQEIENNKDEILNLFEQRLKDQVELPGHIQAGDLVQIVPRQLELLIQTLIECSETGFSLNILAKEQVRLRAEHRKFTLEILISKFILLREVIFEILERKGRVDLRTSNFIWQFIVNAIRISVTEFERERQDESEDMTNRLEESASLNKVIVAQMVESMENEERYKTLVDGVDDYAIFTTDPRGFITSWNPGAIQMKGYSSEEILGSHFSKLYPAEDILQCDPMNNLQVGLTKGQYRSEGKRKRKNGDIFLADIYIRPIYKDEKLLGFAMVVSDLTSKHSLLQASNLNKTEISNLKSEKEQRQKFVMNLTHDLRGPLAVARASAELMKRHMNSGDGLLRFVDKILVAIDRTNLMIGDLLDANRMNAGEKIHLKYHDWDLVRITRNVCDDYLTLGSKVEFHSEEKELMGHWDGDGLRRILENLISNALKYGDNSYPVHVTLTDLGKNISINVHNKGDVITPADQLSIFEQFRRTSSTRHKAGWGIGLSLVKGITEAHQGTVQVSSTPDLGTNFMINLPKIPS